MNFYRITVKKINGPVINIYRFAENFTDAFKQASTRIGDKGFDLSQMDQREIIELNIELRAQRVPDRVKSEFFVLGEEDRKLGLPLKTVGMPDEYYEGYEQQMKKEEKVV